MQSQQLVIASGNRGKVAEFRAYLAPLGWEILPKPEAIDVAETGETFIANAYLKAKQIAKATGTWALADDSGLEVNALGGAPGIYSARYGNSDQARIDRLLQELEGKADRSAQFVCAIAVADPSGKVVSEAIGICKGEIITEQRGDHGFGYDPVFYVPEQQRTFAEMTKPEKGKISHRAIALEILIPQLKQIWQQDH
ncbi:Nucleoside-triphosphatase rdgB [Thalassoporum mexicanum PCC 7367]|uniref:RdgB/HAM1 family non-canonical purine NTP pyrophosphatase n=1 Tax=Thalassoporum mexicanum TaxID=3457544 RepID=UPI00029FED82|nr:RdgB/HAM1 family non-canonical purine NTP pyrophosphatase [Pseudanabaena sp. PCC 7367]AFY70723.1 Nucleoside-triphosphatase rdgB [Pseudanabaena sp. PCC 7367]